MFWDEKVQHEIESLNLFQDFNIEQFTCITCNVEECSGDNNPNICIKQTSIPNYLIFRLYTLSHQLIYQYHDCIARILEMFCFDGWIEEEECSTLK